MNLHPSNKPGGEPEASGGGENDCNLKRGRERSPFPLCQLYQLFPSALHS